MDSELVNPLELLGFVAGVAAVGLLLLIFRKPVGRAVRWTQSNLFGSLGRRAGASANPMVIVVGIFFVLVAGFAVAAVILSTMYPHTFHLR